MHQLAVYVKEGIPFAWDLPLENFEDFCLFSFGFSQFGVLLLCPRIIAVFHFVHGFW